MAKNKSQEELAQEAEKKKIAEEKRALKREEKARKKEVKKRAKELSKKEDELYDDAESNGLVTFLATLFIVGLWLAVICVIVKLDIGGFGSTVLSPVLKDVPVVNLILPGVTMSETNNPENYGGYVNLKDAVDQIKILEMELEQMRTAAGVKDEEINTLKAEVLRLKEFEQKQVDFQRIRNEFYEEVVYAENGPGAEEYIKYYESIDPTTAEFIYRQVVTQSQADAKMQEYASGYSQMKPKKAAGIFEKMTDNLDLVAQILEAMSPESRAAILAEMDPDIAAKITKIMKPNT